MIQHADDSTNPLTGDIKSVINVVKIIDNFSKVAGPKLNNNKSECILLGPLKIRVIALKI